jgi:hypothetical protein
MIAIAFRGRECATNPRYASPGIKSIALWENVARFKKTLHHRTNFRSAFRKIDDEIWDLRVAVLGEERASQTSSQSVQRSPVEMF